ncbi:MAG: glycosyl transferase [Planctomycetota bacterium]|nr:MAG: glycosyl transferase [Planctomycetota bacterium]
MSDGSIAVVLAGDGDAGSEQTLARLASLPEVSGVAVAGPASWQPGGGVHRLKAEDLRELPNVVEALRWFASTPARRLVWALSPRCELHAHGLRRLASVARDTSAALLYSDYFDRPADGGVALHPLIDYQPGSLRDDFDFGQVVLISREHADGLAETLQRDQLAGRFGGWYDLRLRLSERGAIVRLPEPTYVVPPAAERSAGEAHFNYVDPRNRDYQIEMERIATAHLKRIGAFLPRPTAQPVPAGETFPVEASVIIPVRNRVRTIADSTRSALAQQADFPFNVIVVDNHSTDGTTAILAELAARDRRLVHIVPSRTDLGIGGCWNEAIYDARCGRYAVQLDSDDLYADSAVLARIVAEFRGGAYAAVIGSYTIVDFDLHPIPPGLIDHREWTDDNGHNNALRIAGLGAPRAFHVPTLRSIGFPNVSFGEDYAVALQITRRYPIGRIYDSLYWCRRWEDNTDHALSLETKNRYAAYKDRLRSIEIAARRQANEAT